MSGFTPIPRDEMRHRIAVMRLLVAEAEAAESRGETDSASHHHELAVEAILDGRHVREILEFHDQGTCGGDCAGCCDEDERTS